MMKKLAYSFLLTGALAVGFTACGGEEDNNSSSSSCANDNDCKGDRVCNAGACVDPSSGGGGGGGGGGEGGGGGGGEGGGGGGGGGGEVEGAIGSDCSDNSDCDSQFCRKPAGAFDGKCAVNDFGNMCQDNSECEYGACLYRDIDNDAFGYCTTTCSSFTDCPTFWTCGEVGNAGGEYCINE